ncbi:MAG: EAL domain-containing protein [Pseudomonadota bacterium]
MNKSEALLKQAAAELRQYKRMINVSQDYITLIDENYVYRAVNDVYLKARNKTLQEVLGQNVADVWGQQVFNDFIKDKVDRCLRGEIVNDQSVFEFRESETDYMDVAYYPCYGHKGTISRVIVISRNITSLIADIKRSEAKITHLTYYDALTKLPNRSQFMDRLALEISHANRTKKMLAVLFLDLDHFKRINDTLGYKAGDELLETVASRLSQQLRQSDTVSRMDYHVQDMGDSVSRVGGDEFSIIIPRLSEAQLATVVAKRILDVMKAPFVIQNQELRMTTSVGISLYPNDGHDVEIVLKNASTALYRAKDRGRDNYQFYSPAMNEMALERIELENNLHHALEQNEFLLYYQPQYELRTNKIVGMEALVRWNNRDKGLIPPNSFIPLAEETGLILSIGEWVLRTACKQAKALQDEGFTPLRVAVNLSARQFQDPDLIEKVSLILKETGLPPNDLELEITESAMIQDVDNAISILHDLKKMDITIALDDFGTGYSSLTYLKKFPIDTLKIDRSFVSDIDVRNADSLAIVAAIVAMARKLRIRTVAEGVESEEQLSFLQVQECDEVQGYLLSPPIPAPDFLKLLSEDQQNSRTAS